MGIDTGGVTHQSVFGRYQPPRDGWLNEDQAAAAVGVTRNVISYMAKVHNLEREKRKGPDDTRPRYYYEPNQLRESL